ncbi:MAG: GTPase, partial [Planctomycetota bacterium]
MHARPDATQEPDLLEVSARLSEALGSLAPLDPPAAGEPRRAALLLLGMKLVPELRSKLSLPVFVGVQGGTNTGKSTVFNALAGKLLSPALVQASTTKHPLVYAHERWRAAFLSLGAFREMEAKELEDPRELIVDERRADILYFRFHDDARLEGLALVDSPDFDSALASNALQAARIAALSDVTLFVTTREKYRDRALVAQLVALLEDKARAILVFNRIDEEIVFETVLDDLRSLLPPQHRGVPAIRLEVSRAQHPEEDVGVWLRSRAFEELSALRGEDVKPRMVRRAFEKLAALLREVVAAYSLEVSAKAEIRAFARAEAASSARDYDEKERLPFPERTAAVERAIALTELGRVLLPEPRRGWFARSAGLCVEKFDAAVRRTFVRWAGRYEGSVDSAPEALAEYGRTRDRIDSDVALRLAERLRLKVEAFARQREGRSSLAGRLVRELFAPAFVAGLPDSVRQIHARELEADGWTESAWLASVDGWIRSHPRTVRFLSAAAIALKLAS